MEKSIASEVEKIIDSSINDFFCAIDDKVRCVDRISSRYKSDFPIFRLANKDYFKYQAYEDFLEWKIRDYLITQIIQDFFENSLISPQTTLYKYVNNRLLGRSSFRNEAFGDEYPFAYIIEKNNRRVGIRYSDLCISDKEICRFLLRYRISHVEVIDWSDTDKFESDITSCYLVKHSDKVHFLTLRRFFSQYFSDEIYYLYLTKVRAAVDLANQKLGFNTFPILSVTYISDFKNMCIDCINDTNFDELVYSKFENISESKAISELFSETDRVVCHKNFIDNGLFMSLVGEEDFAQCFITSEYLYNVINQNDYVSFDYTAVTAGYFKSIELLLFMISKIWLEYGNYRDLWIAGGNFNKANDQNITWCRKNPAKEARGTQVMFAKEYERYFSTEMGSLIWFLYDNNNGWYISKEGKDTVHELLLDFKQGCRNDYLHKELINDRHTVELIRNDTLICLYLLLGSCVLTGNSQEDINRILGGYTSYEKLYKLLLGYPKISYFIIQKNKDAQPLKVVSLFDQETTKYNSLGYIITSFKCFLVDDFSEARFSTDEEYTELVNNHTPFEITRNDIPYKIWWYNKFNGQVKIIWNSNKDLLHTNDNP